VDHRVKKIDVDPEKSSELHPRATLERKRLGEPLTIGARRFGVVGGSFSSSAFDRSLGRFRSLEFRPIRVLSFLIFAPDPLEQI